MHTELHVVHNCQPAAFSCLNPRELVEQPGFCISAGTAKKGSTSHGGEGSWAELCFPQRAMIYTSLHKKTQITSLFLLSRNILQSKGPQDPGPSCCWAIKLVKVPFLAQSNTRNKGNTTSLLLHTKSLGCTVSAQPYQLSWEQLFSSRHISPWISWHHKEEGRVKINK